MKTRGGGVTSLRVISQALASGKSSSWFFCSEDGALLVKTCSEKEKKTMLRILPSVFSVLYAGRSAERRVSCRNFTACTR